MSSSTASQWMPTPPPISRHWDFCWSVASRRRGNHSKGTAIYLPSARTTHRDPFLNITAVARGSTLMAEVLIPFVLEQSHISVDQLPQFRELVAAEPSIPHHLRRLKPVFGVLVGSFDMYVNRFVSFSTEEEEPIAVAAQYSWHVSIIPSDSDTSTANPSVIGLANHR